jgi:16S rRNA (adenine1518-N6/adenine1519-N6)-dimethyltransferase
VLLVQKEVAERVAARAGDMSILSVTVQYYCEVYLGLEVPAILFTPPPKVDSQILIMHTRKQALFSVDTKKYFALVKAGFAQRRKKLRSSISAGLGIAKEDAEKMLIAAKIDPNDRPQMLTLEQWYALYKVYYKEQ